MIGRPIKIVNQTRGLVSLASLIVFLSAQIMPCQAQMSVPVHVHTFMPPAMLVHQTSWHTGTDSSSSKGNNSSSNQQTSTNHTHADNTTQGMHHFFHHWHSFDSNNTNAYTANHNSQNGLLSDGSRIIHYQGTQLWSNLGLTGQGAARGINLDLSSTNANMTAGHILPGQNIYINVGGNALAVSAGMKLTPAEYLAVQQVKTGGQTLILDAQGSAVGGNLIIGAALSQRLSSLVIPAGVTVIDLTNKGTLNLNSVVDNGILDVGSRNPLLSSITVNTNTIDVQGQGIFSDIISAGTLSSINNGRIVLDNNLNLNLNATNSITNAGAISSSGSLSLASGSGNIANTGTVTSTNGSINIQSANNINVNAVGGTFQAQNGNINFRDSSYTGAGNINLNGGNYLSQNLNLYSGTGTITGNLGQVSGALNSVADTEHIFANTPLLVLGNNAVNGDPLYASTGNLEIDGTISTSGNNLAVIAGGNIVSGTGGNVANIVTAGGSVWLIAGADITSSSGTTSSPISNGATSLTSVTMQFNNTAGGNIDFTPATASTVISTSGGSVTLLANSNSSTTGNIWFPTSTISVATNNAGGGGGAVLVVAGGNGGTALSGAIPQAIQLGQIQTAGSTTTATGTVQIATATPTVSNGGGSAPFSSTGNVTTTTATFGIGTITTSAQMSVTNIITIGYGATSNGGAGGAGASITLRSGGNMQTGNLLSYGGGGAGGNFGTNGGNGGSAGAISVTSDGGSITVSSEVNASGGGGGGANGNNGGTGGSQATILLSAPFGSVTSGNIFSYAGGSWWFG